MKQIFRNIISIIAAIYFLIAGTGFNLINYCCDSCENKGIEYVTENSCSDVHDHNHDASCCSENHYDNTISDFEQHNKECNLIRLKVETPTINSDSKNIEIVYFNIQLYTAIDLINANVDSDFLTFLEYSPPETHLLSTGRDILCHKSVLLI
ncbi:MAG TPA: hypothetical protein P5084_00180 [Paludibacter sp.]|nr:hypothetical protein [Paludibacter sp.]